MATSDPKVVQQQIALNQKGANLKVDGIMGPLTQAAITKYATPTAPNIPVPAYGSNVTDQSGKSVGQAMFDPNTGKPLAQPTGASTGTTPPPNSTSTSTTGGTSTTNPSAGLDDSSFMGVLNNLNNGLKQNNALVDQKNLIQKQMFDQPLTQDELAKLPPDVRSIVQGGNRDQMALQLQIINDSLQGRNNSVASSIQFLTTGYEQAQTRYNSDVANVLNYAKALNQKPSDVMKALYPAEAARLGTQLDSLAAPLLTTTQVQNPQATTFSTPDTFTAAADAMSQVESQGSYTAVSPTTGALGKYQIMPSDWFSTIGLDPNSATDKQEFLNNPTQQDQLYGQIMQTLSKQYGGDIKKTIAAYFGGDKAAQAVGTPAGDKISDGNMTVNQYVDAVTKGMGITNNLPGTLGSPTIDATTPGYATKPVAGAGGISQAEIDSAAMYLATTGQMLGGSRSTTGVGGLQTTAIKNRAAEISSGANFAANKTVLASLGNTLTQQANYQANMERSINTVDENLKLLSAGADKVNSSDSPLINEWSNLAKSNVIGSGDLAAYKAAIQTVRSEYSNILARGGTVTDSVRTEASTLIPDNITKSQLKQVLDTLHTEGQNVLSSANNEVSSIQDKINKIVGGGTDTTNNTDPLGLR